jgi:RimJ/RimL family protein N-acetyltransferase
VPKRELGYWFDHRQRGKGYGSEFATALTLVAFRLLKVGLIEIHCASTNDPSSAIAKKMGFTLDATLRQRMKPTPMIPNPRDLQIWSMFTAEFYTPDVQERLLLAIDCFDFIGRPVPLS